MLGYATAVFACFQLFVVSIGQGMKTHIIRIGNSRGIRLPKLLLEQAQLADEVELHAEPGRVIIRSAKHPRTGWAEAARRMRERDEDRFLERPVPTRFDQEEWEWR